MMTLGWSQIVLIALVCSAATLAVVSLWLKFLLLPRIQKAVMKQAEIQSEAAAERIAAEVERAVRRGVVQGVADLPSREVLEETTRAVARTGVELVGSGFGVMKKYRRRSGYTSTDSAEEKYRGKEPKDSDVKQETGRTGSSRKKDQS